MGEIYDTSWDALAGPIRSVAAAVQGCPQKLTV